MFEIARKLMMARELQMEEGNIFLLGERIQFVPTQMLVEMLRKSDNLWREGYLQYEATKSAVQKWFAIVSKKKGLKDDELVKWQINIYNLTGWGIFNIVLTEFKKNRVNFTTKNSAVGSTYLRLYGKQKYPVCHIVRGGIAAGANVLNKRNDSEVVELKCIAQGHPECQMVLKPRKEFENIKNKLIRKQLNLDKEF